MPPYNLGQGCHTADGTHPFQKWLHAERAEKNSIMKGDKSVNGPTGWLSSYSRSMIYFFIKSVVKIGLWFIKLRLKEIKLLRSIDTSELHLLVENSLVPLMWWLRVDCPRNEGARFVPPKIVIVNQIKIEGDKIIEIYIYFWIALIRKKFICSVIAIITGWLSSNSRCTIFFSKYGDLSNDD